jgi:EAL domain-containing protein (putative c-di-GMP-specific phosphodiesterase class I)
MSTAREKFIAFAFCWADILIELDQKRNIVFAAGATQPVMGKSIEELIGTSFRDYVAPRDKLLVEQLLAVAAKKGRIDNTTVRLKGAEGPTPPLKFAGYLMPDLGNNFFLAFSTSSEVGADGEYESDSSRDKSTGLLVGDSFSGLAAEKLKESKNGDGDTELTLVNLPGFDSFYESLSEEDREVLMNTMGTTLRANSIGGDSAGEMGDGKFGILHDADLDVADLEAKLAEATRVFDPEGKGVDVQAGTIDVDMTDINDEDLTNGLVYTINHFREQSGADFNVKDIAQNMDSLVKEAVSSLNSFRDVVGDNNFEVAFHPILDVNTGAFHHYEALVRFGGNFEESPYKYITFAEETGLISEFDIAMAQKCVDWLVEHRKDKISVAVNISGISVDDAVYIEKLHALIDKHPWLNEHLLFEITESARVVDLHKANAFVQSLRRKGFHVCLDDFGAGAASFQYLSVLEVDVVKLDGSAVKNAQTAPKGRAFLQALTTLCKTMDVETIAEMVDSVETLEFVRDCGVEYAQGFLFGKPNPDPWQFVTKLDRRLFGSKR